MEMVPTRGLRGEWCEEPDTCSQKDLPGLRELVKTRNTSCISTKEG